MKATKALSWGAALVILVILIYSFATQSKIDYPGMIAEHRQEVDDFMRNSDQSPLADSLKQRFQGLNYFEVDPNYKISASLEKIENNSRLRLGTSDGVVKDYLKYAYANFQLQGQDLRLLVLRSLENDEQDYLFIPFSDATSGEQTYGGGRYLDLEFTNKERLEIDFNLAYNPYCVFSATFSCPLPPSENDLPVAIRAGERIYP